MNARAWFATQSFHQSAEEVTAPNFRTNDFRAARAPRCERCGQPEEEGFSLNDADICGSCVIGEGMQHHAPFALRDRWHALRGHCLCEDCAPPRALVEERDQERRVRTLATMTLWAERVFLGLWTHAEYARAVHALVRHQQEAADA